MTNETKLKIDELKSEGLSYSKLGITKNSITTIIANATLTRYKLDYEAMVN